MIERLFAYLGPFIRYTARYPLRILSVSVFTAIAGFMLAYNLRIDNDLAKLIPRDYPSVQALEKLREQVGAENEVAVAIKSPSLPSNKDFAGDLIDRALEIRQPSSNAPYFTRAEFRKQVDFLQNNALYFATESELDQLEQYLKDVAQEAKEEANPFYIDLDEEEQTETDSVGRELEQMYNELVGSEYYLSEDSLTLVVKLFPNGSQTDIKFIRSTYQELQQVVDSLMPTSYHPEMEVTLAGRFLRTLIEVETITADVKSSFGAGVLMLLCVVVAYFFYRNYRIRAGSHISLKLILSELRRVPVIAVIMALPLTFSICWTFGIAYLTFGNLNIMTSTLGLLLFGMGIDFGIHFFARYMEERGEGNSVEESAYKTFMTTGQAITVVGITTAAAFFILMIAQFKGFSEFGFIAGIGIIFAIVAYIVSLPALLVLFERMKLLNLNKTSLHHVAAPIDTSTRKEGRQRFYISIVVLGLAVISLFYAGLNIHQLEFEYHFGSLEPEYKRF
ncbi:MAG: MMPL family transporter, partial [Balneolaceae bacterium]|nr:MMPL family transporter [Balneolaceae bacterium]